VGRKGTERKKTDTRRSSSTPLLGGEVDVGGIAFTVQKACGKKGPRGWEVKSATLGGGNTRPRMFTRSKVRGNRIIIYRGREKKNLQEERKEAIGMARECWR